MERVHPTYLSLVIATGRDAEDCAAPKFIAGVGMLIIDKLDRDDWRFKLNSAAIDTIADEEALLISLADNLPMPRFLVGEHLEKGLFAPLFLAAERMSPPGDAFVRVRVARLRRALPVDMALGAARRRAPLPYADPAPITLPIAIDINDGKVADRDALRARLEARAIANWLRFLRRPGQPSVNIAGVATLTWMAAQGWKR